MSFAGIRLESREVKVIREEKRETYDGANKKKRCVKGGGSMSCQKTLILGTHKNKKY